MVALIKKLTKKYLCIFSDR